MSGRIPEAFIDDLLARTDLVSLIDSRVHLKRAGKNYSACCPFHQEKTPSFTVSPEKQFYYCFGCGANGNAIGFIMDFDRLSFVDAVTQLAKEQGLEVPQESRAQQHRDDASKPLYAALEAASQFYQTQLANPRVRERALQYLKKRGLTPDTIKQFRIGYAPPGWNNLSDALSKQFPLKVLLDAGLAIQHENGNHYDRFRDRIMFPIQDSRGRTIAFGGRVLGDDKPKYLNSPESPVFHKGRQLYGLYEARQASQPSDRFVIVEGYMDVVALAQHHIPYAVATLGTATSAEHLELLFRHQQHIVFCFDGDEAGRRAAARALDISLSVMRDGREVGFLFLPEGEDPDTLVRQQGPEVFADMIDNATPLSSFFFEQVQEGIQLSTLDGKARLAKQALSRIAPLKKSVFRQLLIEELAQLTGLSSEYLAQATPTDATPASQADTGGAPTPAPTHPLKRPETVDRSPEHSAPQRTTEARPPAGEPARSVLPAETPFQKSTLKLMDTIIRMIMHAPRDALAVTPPDDLRQFQAPYIEVLNRLLEIIHQRPDISAAGILGLWHNEPEGEYLAQLAARAFLVEHDNTAETLRQAYQRLAMIHVQTELQRLIAAGATDRAKLVTLLEKKQQLASQSDPPGQPS